MTLITPLRIGTLVVGNSRCCGRAGVTRWYAGPISIHGHGQWFISGENLSNLSAA